MARILLIDDDSDFAEYVQTKLTEQGHEVRWLGLAEDGLKALASAEKTDIVLLDNKMPGMSGLEFLAALKKSELCLPVILMTAAHHDRTVIEAMKMGAFAYALKPAGEQDLGELQNVLEDALEITRRPKAVALRKTEQGDEDDSAIAGKSKPILEVLMRVGRCAQLDETVLILGETGTGKDLVARAIHTNSSRKHKAFVVINCTALNENLLDDELFGHEQGAFTGADRVRKGRFEHANGGTLFLDEIGDMPLALQAKLLRALENREIVRIGSNDPIAVDVRVVAATHCDLKSMVQEGKFRQDLFYRLEGVTIHLPPLRDRKEDMEILARRFLSRVFSGSTFAPILHPDALQRLRNYHWPGNIRQLQKVLCRAAGVCHGSQIVAEDLDFGELESSVSTVKGQLPSEKQVAMALREIIAWAWGSKRTDLWPLLQERLESELLRFALSQPGISQVQLARRLGMARNTLRSRIERYGLQLPSSES